MEVHPASKSLILKLRDPSRVTSLIPRARVVPIDGINYTQVKFGLDEARVLRNMGIKAPSPIRYFYDWPLRVPGVADPKPFEHQRVSSEFFTLHNRCINLSDMGCVDASTEYLSPEGWVRIDQYAGGHVAQWLPEEQRLEFVAPTEYVKKPCPNMIHWKTRFTDQLLSPEHRVLLYRGDGSHVVIHAYQLKTQAAAQDRDLWLHDGEMLFPAFPLEGSEVSHEPSPDGFKYCFMVPSTFLLLRRNGHVFATGNTGKTKSAMWAADYLMQHRVVNKAVIICPKSTLSSVWEDEIRVNFLGRRSCAVLVGSKERRLKLLEQDVDFYIINHDGLKVIEAELKKRTDINLWLYDEAAAVRNPQSQRHKTFAGLVRPTDWMWLMTGTPCPKEPTDVWGLAKLLGSKKIPHYFTAFKNDLMMQLTQYKWVPKPGAFERAYEALSPSIRFKKSDCLDLPPIVFTTLMADMTKEQKDAYEMMRKDLVADVAGVQITAAHAATKMQKLLQIACIEYNTPVLTNRGWVPICAVSTSDLVWDGVEWVEQRGPVYRGDKQVVVVDGVRMTADHRVLTTDGWHEAGDILNGHASERLSRVEVRLPDCYESEWDIDRSHEESDVELLVRVREDRCAGEPKPPIQAQTERAPLRVSPWGVRDNARDVEDAPTSYMDGRETTDDCSDGQGLAELRRSRGNNVPHMGSVVPTVLGGYGADVLTGANPWEGGQQRPLCGVELSVGNNTGAGKQQAEQPDHRDTVGSYDSRTGRRLVQDTTGHTVRTSERWVECGASPCTAVYDLVECGPRSRFVTRGASGQLLIVHNCGMVYDEYGEGYMLDASERLGVCDELIEESTNNAIVFVPYTKALDMVAQHLRKKGHHVEVVDGRTSNTERKRIFSEFQNEPGRRILVAHPATTAHGLTLTRADLTIWYGPITDLEIFEQANNRMDRPGQKNNMTVACVACNPLELELYSALKNKQLMQNTILAMFKNELCLPNA